MKHIFTFLLVIVSLNLKAQCPLIGGTPTVCKGSVTVLTNSYGSGTWSLTGSAATINSQTGSACYVRGLAAGTATITYTCNPGDYQILVVTVNPSITTHFVTVPSSPKCIGDTLLYTYPGGFNNYTLTPISGGTIVEGGGSTDTFVSIVWALSGGRSFRLNYFDPSTGCGAYPFGTLSSVTTYEPITLTMGYCFDKGVTGSSQGYTAGPNQHYYTGWAWTITPGIQGTDWDIISNNGSNSITIESYFDTTLTVTAIVDQVADCPEPVVPATCTTTFKAHW